MCIICLKPKERILSRELLERCFIKNSDGAGFAIVQDGALNLKKGFFKFNDFWEAYAPLQENNVALIHFRFATHGPKDGVNCHPWKIDDNHVFAHNGVIKHYPNKKLKISDSGQFVESILKPMFASDPEAWLHAWNKELLENFLDNGNKGVILSNTGEYQIYRASYGEWFDGCWYSNDGYKPKKSWTIGNPVVQTNTTQSRPPSFAQGIPKDLLQTVDETIERMNKERESAKKPTSIPLEGPIAVAADSSTVAPRLN